MRLSLKLLETMSPYITHLELDGCWSWEWEEIGKRISELPYLTGLKVNRCDSGDIICSQLSKCRNIVDLSILNYQADSKIGRISDVGMMHLATGLHSLTSLNVGTICEKLGHNNLTSAAAKAIADSLKLLTKLDIGGNENIKDEGAIALAEGLPHLKLFDAGSCGISDVGATSIAVGLR